jgi:ribosomal protein L11 methyltransferase
VKVASENARLNGVGGRIALFIGNGLQHPKVRAKAPFDFLVANILAVPLVRLAPSISRAVVPGATLVLSGILIPQAREVIATYLAHGFALERHDRITGWSTLTFWRR